PGGLSGGAAPEARLGLRPGHRWGRTCQRFAPSHGCAPSTSAALAQRFLQLREGLARAAERDGGSPRLPRVACTDVLRRVLEHAMQRLIEAEAATQIGAGPHERASTRTTYRNGYRERILDTGSGRLELQIPKLRSGSFFPSLLEPRRRIDRALLAVVQEAYVLGISTRKVDDLMVYSAATGSIDGRRKPGPS